MSNAIGIIPARWASTRFPGKPLHVIAGKPLLRRVWERVCRSNLDQVIIATDDKRIANAAKDWGADVMMTSRSHQSGTDRIAEVAKKKRANIIVNIQGDEPLIEPRLIDKLVETLRRNRKIDIVTAGHPFGNAREMSSPHQVKVFVNANDRALDFSRTLSRSGGFQPPIKTNGGRGDRRSLRLRVLRHQGIYAFRRSALLKFVKLKQTRREISEKLEQLRALENGVTVHVLVTKHGSPGVDTPQDAKTVEAAVSAASRRKTEARRLPPQR
jgi:3-deoxy-manno-octulosonate cytidylyltransferase (CMP-KDO synthetase)